MPRSNNKNNNNNKLYSMNGAKRGKVLIFNQVTFDDPDYQDRTDTDRDVERLYHSFLRLYFKKEDIVVYEDMRCSEIFRIASRRE